MRAGECLPNTSADEKQHEYFRTRAEFTLTRLQVVLPPGFSEGGRVSSVSRERVAHCAPRPWLRRRALPWPWNRPVTVETLFFFPKGTFLWVMPCLAWPCGVSAPVSFSVSVPVLFLLILPIPLPPFLFFKVMFLYCPTFAESPQLHIFRTIAFSVSLQYEQGVSWLLVNRYISVSIQHICILERCEHCISVCLPVCLSIHSHQRGALFQLNQMVQGLKSCYKTV